MKEEKPCLQRSETTSGGRMTEDVVMEIVERINYLSDNPPPKDHPMRNVMIVMRNTEMEALEWVISLHEEEEE